MEEMGKKINLKEFEPCMMIIYLISVDWINKPKTEIRKINKEKIESLFLCFRIENICDLMIYILIHKNTRYFVIHCT